MSSLLVLLDHFFAAVAKAGIEAGSPGAKANHADYSATKPLKGGAAYLAARLCWQMLENLAHNLDFIAQLREIAG